MPTPTKIAATTAILIMAANTSFADFPRLCALHAGDGFLLDQVLEREDTRVRFSADLVPQLDRECSITARQETRFGVDRHGALDAIRAAKRTRISSGRSE